MSSGRMFSGACFREITLGRMFSGNGSHVRFGCLFSGLCFRAMFHVIGPYVFGCMFSGNVSCHLFPGKLINVIKSDDEISFYIRVTTNLAPFLPHGFQIYPVYQSAIYKLSSSFLMPKIHGGSQCRTSTYTM